MYRILFVTVLLLVIGLSNFSPVPGQRTPSLAADTSKADRLEPNERSAPVFNNLGNYHFPISTQSPQAQRYFDQGVVLAYGFNHAGAARSFKEAAKHDPNCAMCYWGLALVLGPNINMPMAPEAGLEAWQATQKAIALSTHSSKRERDYIQTLAKRYSPEAVEDRKPLDIAYAQAMRDLARRHPEDLDAATLFAEALMDTMPWDYWAEDGTLKPEGREIVASLEAVLAKSPNHPGANHLYIHAVEKERPELGIAAADRLRNLVPGAGHLVHMPSHIYIRVGRYGDAVAANQQAIAADSAYIAQCRAQGVYPLVYMPHNHHFLWFSSLMTGQSKIAFEAARQTAQVDPDLMRNPEMAGILQHFYSIPIYTDVRFGQWQKILATPEPPSDLNYPTGVWHYARGMALIAQGESSQAEAELAALQSLAAAPDLQELKIFGLNSTATILKIASDILTAQLAAARSDYPKAIAHLQSAIATEDALVYTEPADWYHPTRQFLGTILLRAKRPEEAEEVYRSELAIYPDNGWSLSGLTRSLEAQGKTQEARAVQAQFQSAWQDADIQPDISYTNLNRMQGR